MHNLKAKLGLNSRLSMLIPYLVLAVLFIIVPLVYMVIKAVVPAQDHYNNWADVETWSLWKIMFRSVWVGIVTAFVSLFLGFPFAYMLARSNSLTFKSVSIVLLVAPMFAFTIIKVIGIRSLFSSIFGSSSQVLASGWYAVFGLTYLNLPFMILPIYSVVNSMPKNLEEASLDMGYNKFQTMFKVVIPYCLKSMISGLALVFILAGTSLIISHTMMNEEGQVKFKMIANIIDEHAFLANKFDVAKVATISLVTTLVFMGFFFLIKLATWLFYRTKGGIG